MSAFSPFTGRVPGVAFGDLQRRSYAVNSVPPSVSATRTIGLRPSDASPRSTASSQSRERRPGRPSEHLVTEQAAIRHRRTPNRIQCSSTTTRNSRPTRQRTAITPRLVASTAGASMIAPSTSQLFDAGLAKPARPHHVGMILELRPTHPTGRGTTGRTSPSTAERTSARDARDPQPATHERLASDPSSTASSPTFGTQVEQTLIPVGLLQRRQIAALAVLHQHQLTLGLRIQLTHNARHPFDAGQLARRQTTMTNHHTKQALAVLLMVGCDHERLLQSLFADAVGQFGDVAHVPAGVVRVGDEVGYVDVDDVDRQFVGSLLLNRCAEILVRGQVRHALPAPALALMLQLLASVLAFAHDSVLLDFTGIRIHTRRLGKSRHGSNKLRSISAFTTRSRASTG